MLKHRLAQERIITRAALIEALYSAYLERKKRFTILLADHMGPAEEGCHPNSVEDLRTFEQILENLLRLVPLASGECAFTMQPDEQDHTACVPETIRTQWVELLKRLAGDFDPTSRLNKTGRDRPAMYDDFPRGDGPFDFVICAGETADYGNLVLDVNPSASPIFCDFERMPVELLMALRHNHSRRIVIMPGSSGLTTPGVLELPTDKPSCEFSGTVLEAAKLVSQFWNPDAHDDVIGKEQRPLRVYMPSGDENTDEKFRSDFDDDWKAAPLERIEAKDFVAQAGEWRNSLILMCDGPASDPHLVMINGPTTGVS